MHCLNCSRPKWSNLILGAFAVRPPARFAKSSLYVLQFILYMIYTPAAVNLIGGTLCNQALLGLTCPVVLISKQFDICTRKHVSPEGRLVL